MTMDIAEISFTVDGTEYALTPPSPRIAFKVSRSLGGVARALERCKAADLDAFVAMLKIICPAAPKDDKALEAFVYENLLPVGVAMVRYAWSLENGGKAPPSNGDPEPDSDASAEGNGEAVGALPASD